MPNVLEQALSYLSRGPSSAEEEWRAFVYKNFRDARLCLPEERRDPSSLDHTFIMHNGFCAGIHSLGVKYNDEGHCFLCLCHTLVDAGERLPLSSFVIRIPASIQKDQREVVPAQCPALCDYLKERIAFLRSLQHTHTNPLTRGTLETSVASEDIATTRSHEAIILHQSHFYHSASLRKVDQHFQKALSCAQQHDLAQLPKLIGDTVYFLDNACLYFRGSSSITQWLEMAMYLALLSDERGECDPIYPLNRLGCLEAQISGRKIFQQTYPQLVRLRWIQKPTEHKQESLCPQKS